MGVDDVPVKHTFIHFEEKVCEVLLARAVTCPDRVEGEASTASPSPKQSEHAESDDQVSEIGATEQFHSFCEFNVPATPEHSEQEQEDQDPFMMDASHTMVQQCCFVPAPCALRVVPPEQGLCPSFIMNWGFPINLSATVAMGSEDQRAPITKEPTQERAPREMPASTDDEESFTTVMLRNLPNNMTREDLLEMLRLGDFDGSYDLVYLPMDFKPDANLGYAFVNFVSPASAQRARSQYSGYQQWSFASDKVCATAWSKPEQQGYAKNVERYRNSPVMHHQVADSYKPVVFSEGRRVPFPSPTRKLKKPNNTN